MWLRERTWLREYCRSLARMASVTMASASRSWSMTAVVQYVGVRSVTPV